MIARLFNQFAADDLTVHIAPGTVFQIGGVSITNSMLFGWASLLAIIIIMVAVARRVTVKPRGGFTQFIEFGVEFITNLVEGVFNDKRKGAKYVPFFVTLFFFLLFNNWFGLLPGVGEAFVSGDVPLLRAFTADLNGTFAAGIVTMAYVYYSSVRESGGFVTYMKHFFVGSPLNPLYLIIGLLEMVTDLTRVFSLSLRLFLNVAIGEIVIAVFAYLGHVVAPLTAMPFTLVELFVGALQAYIFVVLSLMYLSITVNHVDEHGDHQAGRELTKATETGTMKLRPGEA